MPMLCRGQGDGRTNHPCFGYGLGRQVLGSGCRFRELPLIVKMLVPVSCELCFRSLAIESAIAGLGRET